MAEGQNSDTGQGSILQHKYWLTGLCAGLLIIALGTIFNSFGGSFGIPSLALGGMIVLLFALFLFTVLMNTFDLSDKTQALGLPEGSVRAIIALSLVGLFGILSASVLSPSRHASADVTLKGQTNAQIVQLIADNTKARNFIRTDERKVGEGEPTWTVTYTLPSEPVDDFTKQMLTLVGTLMTAIASFYFGGRTAAPTDVSRAPPKISEVLGGSRPPPGSKPISVEILGTDLNSIRKVRLSREDAEIEASSVTSNPNKLVCSFTFPAGVQQTGTWDVTVVDDIGRSDTKKDGLILAEPAGTSTPAQAPANPAPTDLTYTPPVRVGTAHDFVITGTNLQDVVKIVASPAGGGATAPDASILSKSPGEIKCTLALPKDGEWTVAVHATDGTPVPIPGKTITVVV